jgi:hypothetical protein
MGVLGFMTISHTYAFKISTTPIIILIDEIDFKATSPILHVWPSNNVSHIQDYLFIFSQASPINMKFNLYKVGDYK